MPAIFLKILFAVFISNSIADIILRDNPSSDIEDIILLLNDGLVLNLESPANTLIGEVLVLTYSRKKPKSVVITPENHLVYLVGEKLFLRDSGNVILRDVNHILFEVTATDINDPPGSFSKYLRIPVDHIKEDAVLQVDSIDNLCNTDSNRRLFSLNVADPKYEPNKPYDCRITRSNYPNIDYVELKVNSTRYEFFLPAFDSPFQTSFFDTETKPVLLIEIACENNYVITHQRTVDFKICKKVQPIENILLDDDLSEDKIIVQFNSSVGSVIARLKVVDYSNRFGDDYEFYLAEPNDYLDVSKTGTVRLKRKLDITLLKYYYPKLRIQVGVADLNEPGRDIRRVFRFNINSTGQPLPDLRFRPDFQLIPIFQFAQSAEFLIKLGQFELNSTTYPLDRYDIRLAAGNVTLDDQGNLFIGQDPLKDVDTDNKTAIIALNIYDKKANVSVFEDIFEIDIPDIPTTIAPTGGSNTTSIIVTTTTSSRTPDVLECTNDRDCNNQRVDGGPNKCIRLSSLRELNLQNKDDTETTLRLIQFLNNKDASLFLKYNEILLVLQSQDKELQDVLDRYQITQKDLANVGACLCDQDSQGWRCATPLPNDKPYQCHPNSTVPSCTPQNGICRPSEFLLRNSIKIPPDRLLEYRSYYCECTATGIIGVNCDFRQNPCDTSDKKPRKKRQIAGKQLGQQAPFLSDPVSRYPNNNLGSIDTNQGQCNADPSQEFCQPLANSTDLSQFKCVKQPQKDVVNYLVFDESTRNPNFANVSDNYKKLNLSDASVAMGIQSLIRDEIIPRYSYNDYSKIPKGPLAIMRPSINMPNTLNNVRNKINGLIDRRADEILNQLQNNRVQDLVQDTLLYLMANNLLNKTITPENLTQTIFQLIVKLNLSDLKNFSTPLWNLIPENFPPNITDGNDPTGLIRHLNALQSNSDKINSPELLGNVLGLNAPNDRYIDFFNFSTRPYSLLKLDILPGIFVDSDNELSLRPVPGVFLESIPTDPTSPDRELIFLPGIFNPASSPNCDLNSIFTPGIMSLPIDNYDLANLPLDNSRYLNRFIPMQLPFNINGFLTPLRSSTSDTIASLLMQDDANNFNSHLLLTPIDFSPDSTFDIITKNDKFMNNLFSNRSFYKIVEEQKQLDAQNLASTQILSNPTMLPISKKQFLNSGCINQTGFLPKYDARGSQFYAPTYPADNVTVMPFVVYDDAGNPIPQSVVKAAIDKYCQNYMAQMNDFHARICDAQNQTNKILDAQKNDGLCPGCPFNQLAYEYYNPKNTKKRNSLPLLILASILALLWLLWMLSLLSCCCCRWCPLYGLFCRTKKKPLPKPAFVMTNKSTKVFKINGEWMGHNRPFDSTNTLIANGELVRSAPKNQSQSFYVFNNVNRSQEAVYSMNGREKVIGQGMAVPTAPISTSYSMIPQFKHEKSELIQTINNLPMAGSVETNTTLLVKPKPRQISTIFSSSLINPGQPQPLEIAPAVRAPGVFIAKRIPALKRSNSIDFPVIDPDYQQVVSIFKRSSSFPYLDVPNFYTNNRFVDENQPTNVVRRFNKTTFVDENGNPMEYKGQLADNLNILDQNMAQDRNKNLQFKLKRLSNYIVDQSNPGSPVRVHNLKSPSIQRFRLDRIESENPPNYKDIRAQVPKEADSNDLVIDWLLRKTTDEEARSSSDDTPRSNLTVVRIDGPKEKPPLLMQSSTRPPAPRCFVCNEKINELFADDNWANQDESIYICDGCYESWYSAPVGVLPPTLAGDKKVDSENETPSTLSTVYSLTKDNKINIGLTNRKKSNNYSNF